MKRWQRLTTVGLGVTVAVAVSAATAVPASAFVPPPLPVTLPAGIAVGSGFTATSIGGTTVAAGGGAAATAGAGVALAPAAAGVVAVGAGVLLGYGLYKGTSWAWDQTHQPDLDAVPPTPAANFPGCGHYLSSDGAASVNSCSIPNPGTPPYTIYRRVNITAITAGIVIYLNYWNATNGAMQWKVATWAGLNGNSATNNTPYNTTVAAADPVLRLKLFKGPASATTSCSSDTTVAGSACPGLILVGDFASTNYVTPAPGTTHPQRTITSTANCVVVATGAVTTVSAVSAPYRENDPVMPDFPSVVCPDGSRLEKLLVKTDTLDATAPTKTLADWTAPATWKDTTSPDYACQWGATAPCKLDLKVRYPDATTSPQRSCFDVPQYCTDWVSDPDRAVKYSCTWGTLVRPLSDCVMYQKSFARTSTTEPEYTDPGAVLPKPGDGTQTDESNCLSSIWSWNPVEWVLTPVKCALQWAFVPKTATMTTLGTRVKTAFNASAPGAWVGAIGDVKAGFATPAEGGCLGPRLSWERLPDGGFYPFKACDGIMATAAGVTKILATIAVTFFGGLACLRALGAGLGWSPGVGKGSS